MNGRMKQVPAVQDERRRIPEAQRHSIQIGALPRVPTARSEVVIAVKHRQPGGVEQPAVREAVDCACEQGRIPTVEEIAGDRKMGRVAGGDVIQLPAQPGHITVVSQVKVREMRDEHISDSSVQ